MEAIKKKCLQCRSAFLVKRNPRQQCCSRPACQKRRQNQWRQQKRQQDTDYRENQRAANQRWRKRNADYWRDYRKTHADSVAKNRERQRERDRQLRAGKAVKATHSRLANSDALTKDNFIESGTYDIAPANGNLANSDALRVEIKVISMGCAS
jgi:hypothetical protein